MATMDTTIDCMRFVPLRTYASRKISTQRMTNDDIKCASTIFLTTLHQTGGA
jgi:hypothetical protein